MAHLTEEMKLQLMKMVGVEDMAEFDNMVKQHVPQIENFGESLNKHSPFDLQQVLMKEQIEAAGINHYRDLDSIEKKVSYVYSILMKDPEFRDVKKLCPTRKKNLKDTERSKKSRDLGNKNFQKKVHEEAIRYYSESILLGPIEEGQGRDVSLGLGNRSVVLYQLGEYEPCLQDIEGALAFGYPGELRYKVYERKARCLQELGNFAESKLNFEKALEALADAKATDEKKTEIRSDLTKSLAVVSEGCNINPVALLATRDKYRIWSSHQQFPLMSDSVTIQYNKEEGRHGVARTNISPGELILIEEPLSWTVNLSMFSTVCQLCVRPVGRTPFPSPSHETALFCSYTCLTQYERELGKYDSLPLMELFGKVTGDTANSAMLAFRCLIRKPFEFYVENRAELFSTYDVKYGTNNEEGWKLEGDHSIYQALYNLVNHSDQLSQDKEIDTVVKTAVLLRYLVCCGYFGAGSEVKSLTEDQAFIGGLVFHFQCGINFNQHGIYEARGGIEAGKKLPLIDVGSAFYPNMVLLNHSCCPNTLRINHGGKNYLVAKHLIKAGEEVTDCYGMHHLGSSRNDRAPIIQKGFKFQCKCQACNDNWPLLHELESRLTPGEMGKLGNLLSKYQSNFREQKFSVATTFCVEYLEKLSELKIQMPHRNYEIASMALSSCFWATLQ